MLKSNEVASDKDLYLVLIALHRSKMFLILGEHKESTFLAVEEALGCFPTPEKAGS